MYVQYNKNLINFQDKQIGWLQNYNRIKLLKIENDFFIENLKKQDFLRKNNKKIFSYKLFQYRLFLKKRKLKRRKLLEQLVLQDKKNLQDLVEQESNKKVNVKQCGNILYPKFN